MILTNGDQWRLLDAQALRRYEAYLQVDLEELVHDPSDLSALRVFYRCFHRSAFERDAEGRSGLDGLLGESNHATRKAEDHLKACVSANEGVMAQLCLGLVESTGKDRFTEEERDAIYRDATYLLYRMVFIMYAEARDLLPMGNPAYQHSSLARLVKTAHEYKLKGIPDPKATILWNQLKRLCNAIYESDERLGIPAYNGGLFDDADKPYLRDGTIADGHLTRALFDLAYQPDGDKDDGYRRIDYRDLSVRHLGSIYEGMIEYKLQIAEETLWARRDGKGNVGFLRTDQEGAPRRNDVKIELGDVYFSQSPGERKATGTYYTPEYIVDYIVRQTVVRGLEDRREPLEERLSGWLEEVDAAIDPSEERRMQRTADEELLRFVEEEVLTFRVCDPAMGNGHFLVNAAHQITAFTVETLQKGHWENPEVDANPVSWRRQVVEHCLYGVDISLMAVELAKLSLWLASVAEGKPLSFLDHHLRQGNSLIGARLEELAETLTGVGSVKRSRKERKAREAGQLSMLEDPAFSEHISAATSLLAQISGRAVEVVADVAAQESDYEDVRAELEPCVNLADLITARYFRVDVGKEQLVDLARYTISGAVGEVPEYEAIVADADWVADERQFFHWSLEFPEVFFDPTRGPELRGFDAVVGNPPYIAHYSRYAEPISRELRSWYERLSGEALGNALNTFLLFLIQGVRLAHRSGFCSMIVPDTLCINERYEPTRRFLFAASGKLMLSILRFPVFPDPTVRCVVPVARAGDGVRGATIRIFQHVSDLEMNRPALSSFIPTTYLDTRPSFTFPFDVSAVGLEHKIRGTGNPLGELAHVRDGINPGPRSFRDQIVFETAEPGDSAIRPLIRGGDIQRYYLSPNTLWVRYDSDLVGPELRKQGASLREQWIFESERLVSRQTSDTLIFAYDRGGTYALNSVHNTIKMHSTAEDILYILSLANSKLMQWYYAVTFQENRDVFPQVHISALRQLPIRRISFEHTTSGTTSSLGTELASYESLIAKNTPLTALDKITKTVRSSQQAHDLLVDLAQEMMQLNKERDRFEQSADLFRFLERDTPCVPLESALGGPLNAGKMVRDPADSSVAHHDIERLRLNQEEDGCWLLEVRAKLRDPEAEWREHQRDTDGNFIRRWLPVYRLPLDEATGRFYHYAFANLDGFDGAGKFPGGFTRSTLKKLQLTKVPKFVPVDLEPLAALEEELAEARRKIRLTDDLIDQIVYKLYGLTEEEIAIVEGLA